MINVMLEPTPADAAKRSKYFIKSRPGRILRASLGTAVRGLFSEAGCLGGDLFAPAGTDTYRIDYTWTATSVGAITGGGVVQMSAFRASLELCAFGELIYYDGSSYTVTSDADRVIPAGGMCVAGLRVVGFTEAGDELGWSKAGLPLDWDASGLLFAVYLPDPLKAVMEIGGDVWLFGSRSTQAANVVGGAAEDSAISPIPGVNIRTGLFGRDLLTRVRDGAVLVGHDRSLYKTSGLGLVNIPDRDLETALRATLAADLALGCAWSYGDGGRRFVGVSWGAARARVRDLDLDTASDWTAYGKSVFDIDFATDAFDTTVVAGKNAGSIWELTSSAYTDAGSPIEREVTIHVPTGDGPIDMIVFDGETYGVPLSGNDASPLLMVSYSVDNGRTWFEADDVSLPTPSNRFKPNLTSLGDGNSQAGLLLKLRWTGAFGWSQWGVWVNPTPDEIGYL